MGVDHICSIFTESVSDSKSFSSAVSKWEALDFSAAIACYAFIGNRDPRE
jgi:hypothetical protein